MNLVSGKNGSGKSAIVHALQFCLGATAKQAGRGAALKDFVRYGSSSCCASVTLWNTGAPPVQGYKGIGCQGPIGPGASGGGALKPELRA